ncbi:MAG TPA: cupin domain-containing protein [Ramlibacter sp.]|jgi:quercetin dioxygenase-like cupin family protein|nr:cupin domain-containing protein [Ramlibacter sp.]
MIQDPHDAGADRLVGAVQRRLLHRIAEDVTARHLTIRGDEQGWQPLVEGIECKVLREDAQELSYLLRLAAGAVIPGHRHPRDEECIVLQGELRIGDALRLCAGDYHLARAGVPHAAITAQTQALIFLRGAPPEVSHFL